MHSLLIAGQGPEHRSPDRHPSIGTTLRLGHPRGEAGGSSLHVHIHLPSPWNSAEANDSNVQTAPRCVAVLPGMLCPFPTHPTAHLPCDLLLPAWGALCHTHSWADSARVPPSPLRLFPWHALEDPGRALSHGCPSINRHLQPREPARPAVGTGAWRRTVQGWAGAGGGRLICGSHYSDESDPCSPGSPGVSRDTVERAMCERSSGSAWVSRACDERRTPAEGQGDLGTASSLW